MLEHQKIIDSQAHTVRLGDDKDVFVPINECKTRHFMDEIQLFLGELPIFAGEVL